MHPSITLKGWPLPATDNLQLATILPRFEQFEVLELQGEKWVMIASFLDLEVASAVARNRSSRMRLVKAIYEDGKLIEQDVIAEVGSTREHP